MAKNNKKLAQIFHFDLYGKRENKYNFLNENSIDSVEWTELQPREPNYFFVQKDYSAFEEYQKGFKVNELFPVNGVGMTTAHDDFVIREHKADLLKMYKSFQETERDAEILHTKFNVRKKKGWHILNGYDNIKNETNLSKFIKPIAYRPFDNQFIFYEDKLVWRTVRKVMQHFLKGENVGLALCKQFKTGDQYVHSFITNQMIESSFVSNKTSEITSTFPLYLYPDERNKDLFPNEEERVPNLNMEMVEQFVKGLGLEFIVEKEGQLSEYGQAATCPYPESYPDVVSPIDILDYIYAVLHSPTYREKYKEFLKIDFPRIPYPKDKNTFWQLVKLGGEIRQIHLLESPKVEEYITQYPVDGNNEITRKITKNSPGFAPTKDDLGKVWINDTQYFDNVPEIAWNFYIGGYQPAQKWLKDRKNRTLEFDDILHYQKIIVALTETDRLMKEIDKIGVV